jgi:SAM-dependent methyltransferase
MNPGLSNQSPRGFNLIRRLFAWVTAHSGGEYEASNAGRKRALFGGLHGDILEIGPGSGPNLRYFPAGVRWTGVEPNPFMHSYLKQSIHSLGLPEDQFLIETGDPWGLRLPAGDTSQDAVVSTLVLCSVPDPKGTLREILRVLKPGGRFAFIEHVAAPHGSRLRASQNLIQPVWSFLGDGCHPNRATGETILSAGFAKVEMEAYTTPGGGLAGPHIAGTAFKNW